MAETVLMRTFLMLYPTDYVLDGDDDLHPVIFALGKSRSSERQAFRLLSSVCSYWHQTLVGWPESPTSQWVRHQTKKLIERKYTHSYVTYMYCAIVVVIYA